jgi:glutamyl-tRNA reductase
VAILALGVSYRLAPVELLERLAFSEEDLPKAYHHLATLDAVDGAVVLSTCNRVEVYAEVEG